MSELSQRFPDTVIRASAGTGKTFQLSNRYLGLLHSNQPPEQILASTFARKAAGEILERVMIRLAEAADNDNERQKLANFLNAPDLTQERCALLLSQLVQHLHQLRVGTLDAFFVQTAGNFALEFGLPGGWTILEDIDDRQLRIEALRIMLRQRSKSWDELTTLIGLLQKGESARDVIDSLLSTIDDFYALFQETESQAWLGQPKLPTLPVEQLALHLVDFVDAQLPTDKRFAKAHAKAIELAQREDWETFLTAGLAKAIITETNAYYKKPLSPELIAVYEPLVAHARGEVVHKIMYQTEATYHLLESFHGSYHPLKLKRRGLRFEDITRSLAENLPKTELQHVEYRLDSSLHHLLLDEFQDTSLLQWQVIQLFAREVNNKSDKTFFCVGDVKQAIYGWRGGISEIFDKVASELKNIKDEKLTESRRSAPVIMDVVNGVFSSLNSNPSLESDPDVRHTWADRFKLHDTFHQEYQGYFQLETYPVDDEDKTDKWQKARFAAEKVATLHRDHPGCTIGVLTRTNQTVGRIIHYLRNPVGDRDPVFASEEGGNPLTDAAAVIYILSLMKMAAHPGDLIARFNVVHSPLADVIKYKNHRSDSTARAIAARIRRQLLQEGYGPTIDGWVRELAAHCDRRELDRLLQLVELAWEYEARATLNPADFVTYVEETKVESPSSADVRVMTVHQSKGLQFDLVVLPELDGNIVSGRDKYIVERVEPTAPVSRVTRYFSKDLLPLMPDELQTMHAQHRARTINEALCLLYVAITRAVHALHVIVDSKQKPESLRASTIMVNSLSEVGLEPATTLREIGQADWYEHHKQAFRSRLANNDLETKAEEIKPIQLADPGNCRRRNLELIKPSAHETGVVSMSELLEPTKSLERARGSLIHAWLEHICWLDDGLPEDRELLKTAGQFARPGLEIPSALDWFKKTLEAPSMIRELESNQYRSEVAPELFPALTSGLVDGSIELKVQQERRIVYRTDTEMINGIVDRVVLYQQDGKVIAADVIDYKTDSASSTEDIERLKTIYRPQLEKYGRAMQTLYELDEDRVVIRLGLISAREFCRL